MAVEELLFKVLIQQVCKEEQVLILEQMEIVDQINRVLQVELTLVVEVEDQLTPFQEIVEELVVQE